MTSECKIHCTYQITWYYHEVQQNWSKNFHKTFEKLTKQNFRIELIWKANKVPHLLPFTPYGVCLSNNFTLNWCSNNITTQFHLFFCYTKSFWERIQHQWSLWNVNETMPRGNSCEMKINETSEAAYILSSNSKFKIDRVVQASQDD